jgi:hypothetical protein
MPNNPVMAARFTYLTTRQHNRLARQQARTACAAALLRWIHAAIIQHITWDPAIAPLTPRRERAHMGFLLGVAPVSAAVAGLGSAANWIAGCPGGS